MIGNLSDRPGVERRRSRANGRICLLADSGRPERPSTELIMFFSRRSVVVTLPDPSGREAFDRSSLHDLAAEEIAGQEVKVRYTKVVFEMRAESHYSEGLFERKSQ